MIASLSTGKRVECKFEEPFVFDLAFISADELLAMQTYDAIQLFSIEDGSKFRSIPSSNRNFAWAERRRLLATQDKGSVRLLDLDGTLVGAIEGVRGSSLRFSPDEKLLLVFGTFVTVCDIDERKILGTVVSLKDGVVLLSPDGRYRQLGEDSKEFAYRLGLRRYPLGVLDEYFDLKLPDDWRLIPSP